MLFKVVSTASSSCSCPPLQWPQPIICLCLTPSSASCSFTPTHLIYFFHYIHTLLLLLASLPVSSNLSIFHCTCPKHLSFWLFLFFLFLKFTLIYCILYNDRLLLSNFKYLHWSLITSLHIIYLYFAHTSSCGVQYRIYKQVTIIDDTLVTLIYYLKSDWQSLITIAKAMNPVKIKSCHCIYQLYI